jgi:hypothetical protein
LALDPTEKGPGIEKRLTGLDTLKRDGTQEGGQKTSNTVVTINEFLVIVVVGRPRQVFHFGACCKEVFPRNPLIGFDPYLGRFDAII